MVLSRFRRATGRLLALLGLVSPLLSVPLLPALAAEAVFPPAGGIGLGPVSFKPLRPPGHVPADGSALLR
ncbi:hypothetical protein MBTS_22275 [Methylobacterium bullatum]|uniref:hypothetical protein n=1 Tax=Methylobacterium bullatum TaxID=570505 RepID=UPI00177A84A4|nr:hypothetical protein [Methylobacterium bullatum]MBD8904927.1 hypothetical protein [Methylobacterium bullatum]